MIIICANTDGIFQYHFIFFAMHSLFKKKFPGRQDPVKSLNGPAQGPNISPSSVNRKSPGPGSGKPTTPAGEVVLRNAHFIQGICEPDTITACLTHNTPRRPYTGGLRLECDKKGLSKIYDGISAFSISFSTRLVKKDTKRTFFCT
jgi:hypothetical protein